jgi:hypothetical protein
MNFTYNIAEDNSVTILENDVASVTQPLSPVTGEPFASYEEAKAWAEADILQRISWLTALPIGE